VLFVCLHILQPHGAASLRNYFCIGYLARPVIRDVRFSQSLSSGLYYSSTTLKADAESSPETSVPNLQIIFCHMFVAFNIHMIGLYDFGLRGLVITYVEVFSAFRRSL
jgi:hypothetical protein